MKTRLLYRLVKALMKAAFEYCSSLRFNRVSDYFTRILKYGSCAVRHGIGNLFDSGGENLGFNPCIEMF